MNARHWPEYAMEAFGLGLFLVSAGVFAVLLEHPASPAHQAISDPFTRRSLLGVAMGLTAVVNIYSPWGKRSGAHLNPATTLTYWRLGKVSGRDAIAYAAAQFVGGAVGAALVALALRSAYLDPPVAATATVPGPAGAGVALVAEVGLTFVLMSVVLVVTNAPRFARFTGLVVGAMVAAYITVEAPLSGMSMNPARSFATAVVGATWPGLWVYFVAPPLGMLLAAQVHLWRNRPVRCAKMHHDNPTRCIFCDYQRGSVRREHTTR